MYYEVEGALLQANQTAWPFVLIGPTMDDLWQYRVVPTDDERSAFTDRVHCYQDETLAKQGYLPGAILTREQQNSIDRVGISRALIELGYLVIRRVRIPLPF